MWRPDRSVRGPERATLRDVEPLSGPNEAPSRNYLKKRFREFGIHISSSTKFALKCQLNSFVIIYAVMRCLSCRPRTYAATRSTSPPSAGRWRPQLRRLRSVTRGLNVGQI